MSEQPITLPIADDHPVVRAGLRALIATDDGLTVVGDAATPDDAVRAARGFTPMSSSWTFASAMRNRVWTRRGHCGALPPRPLC